MPFRLLILAARLALAARAAEPPADFAETFDQLAAFCDREELGALEVAQGSMLAARFYGAGPDGLPANRKWFRGASTRGQASVAGLFLAVHAPTDDLVAMRRELETNRTKRGWLYEMVGTEKRFEWSLANGKMWAPFTRVLPATDGCRTLAVLCLRSRDPLVRRGGAFWGYWFADDAYWGAIRRMASADADALTRKVAASLLQRAPRATARPARG